jgi:hypothetical protein
VSSKPSTIANDTPSTASLEWPQVASQSLVDDRCRARMMFEDGDARDMAERHDQWLKI